MCLLYKKSDYTIMERLKWKELSVKQTCKASRISCETCAFSSAQKLSRAFSRAATHNFYARFLQERDYKLQLITTRQPVG